MSIVVIRGLVVGFVGVVIAGLSLVLVHVIIDHLARAVRQVHVIVAHGFIAVPLLAVAEIAVIAIPHRVPEIVMSRRLDQHSMRQSRYFKIS